MKKIILEISDEALEMLNSEFVAKQITDNVNGVIDNFMYLILVAIQKNKEKLTIIENNHRQNTEIPAPEQSRSSLESRE